MGPSPLGAFEVVDDPQLPQLEKEAADPRAKRAQTEGEFLQPTSPPFARGEQVIGSDVDLLIVLDRVSSYFGEIRRTGRLIASLALTYDVSVSRVFVSESDWREGDGPFLVNVRRDAVGA